MTTKQKHKYRARQSNEVESVERTFNKTKAMPTTSQKGTPAPEGKDTKEVVAKNETRNVAPRNSLTRTELQTAKLAVPDLQASTRDDNTDVGPELNSFFDTPEGIEFEARMRREAIRRSMTLPLSEQLRRFLHHCNQRGHRYRPALDFYPTHTQLARYCFCSPSGILRISTGETRSIKSCHLDILMAIACLIPTANVPPGASVADERKSRMRDADCSLATGADSPMKVQAAIFAGITSRLDDHAPSIN